MRRTDHHVSAALVGLAIAAGCLGLAGCTKDSPPTGTATSRTAVAESTPSTAGSPSTPAAAPPASTTASTSASSPRPTPPTQPTTTCERTLTRYPELAPGARSAAVATLQCLMNDAHLGPLAVDGVFGPQTKAAVVRLADAAEGAPMTTGGRVNAAIWQRVIAATLPERVLRRGDHGTAVVTLQRALRAAGYTIAVDGAFGPQTEAVLKTFQRRSGTSATGVTDESTIFALKCAGAC